LVESVSWHLASFHESIEHTTCVFRIDSNAPTARATSVSLVRQLQTLTLIARRPGPRGPREEGLPRRLQSSDGFVCAPVEVGLESTSINESTR
jgi:hypothetical protein